MDEIIGYSLSTLLQLKNANNQFFIRNYNLIKRFILEKDIPTLGIFHAYKTSQDIKELEANLDFIQSPPSYSDLSPKFVISPHFNEASRQRSRSLPKEKNEIPRILSYVDLEQSLSHKKTKAKITLFYAKDMEEVAHEAEKLSDGKMRLGKIRWDTFPDGTPQIYIEDVENLKNMNVAFLASCNSTDKIFDQLSVLYALPNYLAKTMIVVLPFFATGTMERVEKLGQVATASTLARIFSIIPYACEGPTQLCIFDIHALQEQFYFTDNDTTVTRRIIKKNIIFIYYLFVFFNSIQVTIVFPDDGAKKRFYSKFPEYPYVVCSKTRDGDKRIVRITEGTVKDRYCIIVDDLIQTGGTILECIKACKSGGARAVSAYCTHAVFPCESWKKFTNNDLLEHFWITNTIPVTTDILKNEKPFEVLSIAPIVAYVINGLKKNQTWQSVDAFEKEFS